MSSTQLYSLSLHDALPILSDPRGDSARERVRARGATHASGREGSPRVDELVVRSGEGEEGGPEPARRDRKSTRLNSSHLGISYAVFCLKKKMEQIYIYS